jgi:CDP-diacylglycerol--serine O-phosphatidyltransferase
MTAGHTIAPDEDAPDHDDDHEDHHVPSRRVPGTKYLPNTLTLLALITGLVSLYFALAAHWEASILTLVLAGLFDKADGAAARIFNCESVFGARFDSCADAVNFGVVPAAILYLWTGASAGVVSLLACLIFTGCAWLRLIRFTRNRLSGNPKGQYPGFFTGVPTPAAAFLCLLPVMLALETGAPPIDPLLVAAWLVLIGVLMLSPLPAYKLAWYPAMRPYRLLVGVVISAVTLLLLIKPLGTLIVIDIAYLASMPVCYRIARRAVS